MHGAFPKAAGDGYGDAGALLPYRVNDDAEPESTIWPAVVDAFRTALGPELLTDGEPLVTDEPTAYDWVRWLTGKASMDWLSDVSSAIGDNTRYSNKTSRAKAILKILHPNVAAGGAGE